MEAPSPEPTIRCRCGAVVRSDGRILGPARRFCSRDCYFASLKVPLAGIYRRDAARCHLCGRAVARHEASRDHLVPRSRGGPTTWWNLALAHRECNSRRGDTALSAWRRGLRAAG
jgi:hypothetical protein